ncbi:MAG: hypothetical protein J5922_03525 [Clostridia bacterium]|nr:hypothetical protein [Clostridia bacterium]
MTGFEKRQKPRARKNIKSDATQENITSCGKFRSSVFYLDKNTIIQNHIWLDEDAIMREYDKLRKFGFCEPIKVNDKNEITEGGERFVAAKRLGFEAVPCVLSGDELIFELPLCEPKKRRFIFRDLTLFYNTVSKALAVLRGCGVNAEAKRVKTKDGEELNIKIYRGDVSRET